eukprot:CAMPEP_0194070520 /NCGR_PEP_ID=MMETSP0009_2-20130614/88227_1 /TAXON_ID=210454 /ORGANISM="Grammatophora oceanica, Strain CCMP 410" /LENGTH=52 /DNA_ID=CAMNT_0038723799 /DNA_START=182 /DNA_END=340 /DNA_ORIENTATION=-
MVNPATTKKKRMTDWLVGAKAAGFCSDEVLKHTRRESRSVVIAIDRLGRIRV